MANGSSSAPSSFNPGQAQMLDLNGPHIGCAFQVGALPMALGADSPLLRVGTKHLQLFRHG